MDWKKGLQNAPRIGDDEARKILAWEDGSAPSFVVWRPYDPAVVEACGREGYWDYEEDLVAEVTGGVAEDREPDFYWTEVDFSVVLELSRSEENNADPAP